MRMALLCLAVVCAFGSRCCHAVEVRLHCDRAVVTGKPQEVADFGLGYLLHINPQLKDTPEWRAQLVDAVLGAADGHLTLETRPKACLDAIWAQARKSKASVITTK